MKVNPAAFRIASILELFARNPARSWSLSEIVAEVDMRRSTCHVLLTSLDLANLIYRDEGKRYVLGSLAASIGRAATRYVSGPDLIHHELFELAGDCGVVAAVNYLRGDQILIRELTGEVIHERCARRAGDMISIAPPWGAVFYAWEPVKEQVRWLSNPWFEEAGYSREDVMSALTAIRLQGFIHGVRSAAFGTATVIGSWDRHTHQTDHFHTHLHAAERYRLGYLAAPVFDWQGRIAFVLSLTGFAETLTGTEIRQLGEKLKRRCRNLSNMLQDHSAIAPAREGGFPMQRAVPRAESFAGSR